jgi:hypothetical protein
MRSSPLRTAVFALLLVVAGVGFLRAVEDALEGLDTRGRRTGPPLSWRFGKAPVVALAECVGAARGRLPVGSVVAFAGPVEPRGDRLLRWRWATYFLPRQEVVQYRGAGTVGDPGHVIACRRRLDGDPRLVEVGRLRGGRLYRVQPAAAVDGRGAKSSAGRRGEQRRPAP